jgi:hypothetical protein
MSDNMLPENIQGCLVPDDANRSLVPDYANREFNDAESAKSAADQYVNYFIKKALAE